jgi:hypothetical protein
MEAVGLVPKVLLERHRLVELCVGIVVGFSPSNYHEKGQREILVGNYPANSLHTSPNEHFPGI